MAKEGYARTEITMDMHGIGRILPTA